MTEWNFNGKVALITGGSSGIGEACVLAFAHNGARVVIADLDKSSGEKVARVVKKAGGEAIFLPVDVSVPEAAEKMILDTLAAFDRLDIAVNNAGIGGELHPTGEYSIDGWIKVINANLNSVFYCMRYEIPIMLRMGGGCIVNMSSILGTVGTPNSPAYVAAKHGIIGLTKTAALEYAQQGVRINAVAPAYIQTPLLDSLDDTTKTYLTGLHPIGRLGQAREVSDLVMFLCSDQASFMTGGTYLVDGGYTAR